MGPRLRDVVLVVAFAAAPVVFASAARADEKPVDERAQREALARLAMKRGLAAMARGNAAAALEDYRLAQTLVPDANLPHRYEAEALIALGNIEGAIAAYARYLELKPDVSDADMVRARIETLREKLAAAVYIRSDPPGARVYADGAPEPIGTTPLRHKMSAGAHRFVLKLDGWRDAALDRTLSSTSETVIDSTLDAPTDPRRTLGLVVGAAGAAILVTSAVLDLTLVHGSIDRFQTARSSGDPSAADLKDTAESNQRVVIVGYVVGGVTLAAGAAVFGWASLTRPSRGAAQIRITPGGAMMTGTF